MRDLIKMAFALLGSVKDGDNWDDVLDLGDECVELDSWDPEWL